MKNFMGLFFALAFITSVHASGVSEETPVQHLKVPDVTSLTAAKQIFIEKTLEMKGKQELNETELQQIHIITYSLEKSVAFFAEKVSRKKQELIKQIAVVVEDIHLNSENNRKPETQKHLDQYFQLAGEFINESWETNLQ